MAKLLLFADLSPIDDALFYNANRMVKEMNIEEICICHYVEIQEVTDDVRNYFNDLPKPLEEILQEDFEEKATAQGLDASLLTYKIHLSGGKDDLINWVNRSDYDLCVFGKKVVHSGTGVFSGRLGRLMEKSVLFITESTKINTRRLLLPTEFSKYSKKAAEQVNRLKSFIPEEITVLHVFHVSPTYFPFISELSEDIIEKERKHAQKEMKHFCKKYFPDREVLQKVLYAGDRTTAKLIYDYAITNRIDLIVMGAKGKTDDDEILIGSVAEKLIQTDKNIPVLLVR
jgi:nucleotide-binding universal stress UspA family protein